MNKAEKPLKDVDSGVRPLIQELHRATFACTLHSTVLLSLPRSHQPAKRAPWMPAEPLGTPAICIAAVPSGRTVSRLRFLLFVFVRANKREARCTGRAGPC